MSTMEIIVIRKIKKKCNAFLLLILSNFTVKEYDKEVIEPNNTEYAITPSTIIIVTYIANIVVDADKKPIFCNTFIVALIPNDLIGFS